LDDPLPPLAELIRVPGITGDESAIIAATAALCRRLSLPHRTNENGVVVTVTGAQAGPRLLFCAHLDTVPAGDGWRCPPFGGTIENGVCYGRGAVDDRGCCVALLLAAKQLQSEGLAAGEIVIALSIGEEGNDPSLPRLLAELPPIDAGIVCEPTDMRVATSQRGLMHVDLLTHGEQAHAARAKGPGAIDLLLDDLQRLRRLDWPPVDALLGPTRFTPTRLSAGVADNMTPPDAKARVDIRTTPVCSHAQIIARLRDELTAEVIVIADHLIPCVIADDHPLVAIACAAAADPQPYASDAASDWFALQRVGIPAIKLGPGDPAWSHRADERISAEQLHQGIAGYAAIARSFCRPAKEGAKS